MKIYKARAPLRLGFGGGGTDVSPYSDIYGGAVLNATISLYAYATIQPTKDKKIVFNLADLNKRLEFDSSRQLPLNGKFDIGAAVYNRLVKDFSLNPLSFVLTTYVDVPPGSGLGSSSTLTVAIIGAFAEWLELPLGEYEIAHLAYEIERKELKLAGGKQDQYAAAFGGFNFMEFFEGDKTIVNPLRIRPEIKRELEFRIILYYTGKSRISSKIIRTQIGKVRNKNQNTLESFHKLKLQAIRMKEALLKGDLNEFGILLDWGWRYKKRLSKGVSNPLIEKIYSTAKSAGAIGAKVSGAGGGGFMMIYCSGVDRYNIIHRLRNFKGRIVNFNFTDFGLETWESSQ